MTRVAQAADNSTNPQDLVALAASLIEQANAILAHLAANPQATTRTAPAAAPVEVTPIRIRSTIPRVASATKPETPGVDWEFRVFYRLAHWAPTSLGRRLYQTSEGAEAGIQHLQDRYGDDLAHVELQRRNVDAWEPYSGRPRGGFEYRVAVSGGNWAQRSVFYKYCGVRHLPTAIRRNVDAGMDVTVAQRRILGAWHAISLEQHRAVA